MNSHLAGAPLPIIEALVNNYEAYQDVEISSMLTSDGLPYADEKYKDHFHMKFNNWKGAFPDCPFIQLTTLDENRDAKTVSSHSKKEKEGQ